MGGRYEEVSVLANEEDARMPVLGDAAATRIMVGSPAAR
jgi:hypothetical protein